MHSLECSNSITSTFFSIALIIRRKLDSCDNNAESCDNISGSCDDSTNSCDNKSRSCDNNPNNCKGPPLILTQRLQITRKNPFHQLAKRVFRIMLKVHLLKCIEVLVHLLPLDKLHVLLMC
jgi:hypothetical protein